MKLNKIFSVLFLGLFLLAGLDTFAQKKSKSVEPLYWKNPLEFSYGELNSPKRMKMPKVVLDDADGDGMPDYIKPKVTFTNITCEELEDKFVYKYDINFLGGDNYARGAEVRGGFRMELRDGKFWFSISEADLRNPRYVGPIIYKINSVEDRSWTYYESKNLSKKNWSGAVERGGRGIQSPLTLNALYTGIDESFPKPDIEFSLCKK